MTYDLVFEGGGAKGTAFVGACDEFFRRGHTFGRPLGTSAGAIAATLLAAGYSQSEMLNALSERDGDVPLFATFLGHPAPFSDDEIVAGALHTLLSKVDLKFLPDAWQQRLDARVARALADSARFRHVVAFIDRGGWFGADRFLGWLQAKLDSGPWKDARRTFSGMTLSGFRQATNVELSMVASDCTDGKLLVLNHRTAPACPVVWAVRMSMSIPCCGMR